MTDVFLDTVGLLALLDEGVQCQYPIRERFAMKGTATITFLMLLVFPITVFITIPIVVFVCVGPWAGSIAGALSISLYLIWCLLAPQATFLALLRGNLRRSASREEAILRTVLAYRDRASFENVSEWDLHRASQVFSMCPSNSTVAEMWIELVKKKQADGFPQKTT